MLQRCHSVKLLTSLEVDWTLSEPDQTHHLTASVQLHRDESECICGHSHDRGSDQGRWSFRNLVGCNHLCQCQVRQPSRWKLLLHPMKFPYPALLQPPFPLPRASVKAMVTSAPVWKRSIMLKGLVSILIILSATSAKNTFLFFVSFGRPNLTDNDRWSSLHWWTFYYKKYKELITMFMSGKLSRGELWHWRFGFFTFFFELSYCLWLPDIQFVRNKILLVPKCFYDFEHEFSPFFLPFLRPLRNEKDGGKDARTKRESIISRAREYF